MNKPLLSSITALACLASLCAGTARGWDDRVRAANHASSDFTSFTSAALAGERILLHAPASYLKNAHGFRNVRRDERSYPGSLVLREKHLTFEAPEVPNPIRNEAIRIPYTDVRRVDVVSFGLGRRIVIGTSERCYTFHVSRPQSALVDREMTQRVHDFILERVSGAANPPRPEAACPPENA
jgi:hypothetical protein